jgi:hypothetical protein
MQDFCLDSIPILGCIDGKFISGKMQFMVQIRCSTRIGWIWRFVGNGGLTFALAMRFLGIALGQSVALGTCAAFGTLIPAVP